MKRKPTRSTLRYQLLLIVTIMCFQAHAQSSVDWVKSAQTLGESKGSNVRTDTHNNMYVMGTGSGYVTLDSTSLYADGSACNTTTFIGKYNAAGKLLWLKNIKSADSTKLCFGEAMDIDRDGNIYIAGEFRDTLRLGGAILIADSGTGDNSFIAKYTTNGDFVFAKRLVSAPGLNPVGQGRDGDNGGGMKVSANGDIYLTGNICSNARFDTINFRFDTLNFRSENSDPTEIAYLTKYDHDGNLQWVKLINGMSAFATYLTADADNNVILTGGFKGAYIFLDTVKLYPPPIQPLYSYIFVAKFNSDGHCLWARSGGGNDFTNAFTAVTDKSNNVFISGNVSNKDSTIFGNISIPSAENYSTGYIGKYAANGDLRWVKKTGTDGMGTLDEVVDMTLDAANNMYIVGRFNKYCVWGQDTIRAKGTYDIFVTMYDSNANLQWVTTAGGTDGNDLAHSVAINAGGSLYITGNFVHDCDFGGYHINNNGGNSFFLAKSTFPTSGVQHVRSINSLHIYPNPANNTANVSLDKGRYTELRITDVMGRVVCRQPVAGLDDLSVNTASLSNGSYFITAIGANGVVCDKLMVQH